MPARLIAGAKNCQRAWSCGMHPRPVGREARLAEEMWRQRRVAVGKDVRYAHPVGRHVEDGGERLMDLVDIDTAHVAGRDEAKIERSTQISPGEIGGEEVMAVE